ncbi:uncharacterized protein C8Q71DRAFT_727406 [Rhodofomes roseus]|uniref:Uncharacterized protein n=1 Tax=Rhodofomes roseus TaxID=34475 RepID=A0ABQ8K1X6_9APHY|nr:uncharacterized protein C8Q71DRAFT_727406 [Rhodofomes roseus]KAH9830669.1 hypothetical protein C8Q71DRAFT_727406 [Rhodofomes roseus]
MLPSLSVPTQGDPAPGGDCRRAYALEELECAECTVVGLPDMSRIRSHSQSWGAACRCALGKVHAGIRGSTGQPGTVREALDELLGRAGDASLDLGARDASALEEDQCLVLSDICHVDRLIELYATSSEPTCELRLQSSGPWSLGTLSGWLTSGVARTLLDTRRIEPYWRSEAGEYGVYQARRESELAKYYDGADSVRLSVRRGRGSAHAAKYTRRGGRLRPRPLSESFLLVVVPLSAAWVLKLAAIRHLQTLCLSDCPVSRSYASHRTQAVDIQKNLTMDLQSLQTVFYNGAVLGYKRYAPGYYKSDARSTDPAYIHDISVNPPTPHNFARNINHDPCTHIAHPNLAQLLAPTTPPSRVKEYSNRPSMCLHPRILDYAQIFAHRHRVEVSRFVQVVSTAMTTCVSCHAEADPELHRPPMHIRNMRGQLPQGHVPLLYSRRCRHLEPHSGSRLPPVISAAVVVHLEVTAPLQVPVAPLVLTGDLSLAYSPAEFDDGSVKRRLKKIVVIIGSLLVQSSATPAMLFAQLRSALDGIWYSYRHGAGGPDESGRRVFSVSPGPFSAESPRFNGFDLDMQRRERHGGRRIDKLISQD